MAGATERNARRVVPRTDPAPRYPPTLPPAADPLIGREADVDRAVDLLAGRSRFVTVTGTGGVGKTGLAVEVARRLADDFLGAVVFVSLAPVADPGLVTTAICTAAGLALTDDVSPGDVAARGLADGPALLVVDNLEHVIAAAPQLVRLLDACPELRLLVTSRVATRADGETELELAPLATDDAVAVLARGVRRFEPAFEVGPDNADAVGELCRRLEGLPLALELAAARLRMLAPAELVAMLGTRFDVLRSTMRPALEHQRTLWATIDWSYRLLDAADRHVLRSLAVFAGGFGIEGAARVAGLDAIDLLDRLERLVAHHLVQVAPGGGATRRFSLLDTIRRFAEQQLVDAAEDDAARSAHADWCIELVTTAADQLVGPDQAIALEALDRELDNLRAALRRLLPTGPDERALRLTAMLWRYWWIRGQMTEGRQWLDEALATYSGPPSAAQAAALQASADLAEEQSDSASAVILLERAVEIRIALDDPVGVADCWNSLGISARSRGDLVTAESWHLKALEVFRQHDEPRKVAIALNSLATLAYFRGDVAGAAARWSDAVGVVRELGDRRSLGLVLSNLGSALLAGGDAAAAVGAHEESVQIARSLNDAPGISHGLTNLGAALIELGRFDRAGAVLGEALDRVRALGERNGEGVVLHSLGQCARAGGDPVAAAERWLESLAIFTELRFTPGIAGVLESLGSLAVAGSQMETAATLLIAATVLRDRDGSSPEGDDSEIVALRTGAEREIGPSATAELRRRVLRWAPDEAALVGRQFGERVPSLFAVASPAIAPEAAARLGLTARELEIVEHLVRRQTDKEIATELFISTRTVTTHVSAVLRKLGVASRREVAAAVEQLAGPS